MKQVGFCGKHAGILNLSSLIFNEERYMRIEKRLYKVFYKGRQFAFPIFVLSGVEKRERVVMETRVKK